jgi:hypothetical protein
LHIYWPYSDRKFKTKSLKDRRGNDEVQSLYCRVARAKRKEQVKYSHPGSSDFTMVFIGYVTQPLSNVESIGEMFLFANGLRM